MPALTRRHLLAGAAATAAVAAMPASAIAAPARSIMSTLRAMNEYLDVELALASRRLSIEFSKRVMERLLAEPGTTFEELTGGCSMDDVEWFHLYERPTSLIVNRDTA